jgi:hypothetical protein
MAKKFSSTSVVGMVVPLNAGDVDGALAYWADDATVKLVSLPAGIQDSYFGKEQLRAWFKDFVALHFQLQVRVIRVQGNMVTTRMLAWIDATRQPGIAPIKAIGVYIVIDDKIANLICTLFPEARMILNLLFLNNRG